MTPSVKPYPCTPIDIHHFTVFPFQFTIPPTPPPPLAASIGKVGVLTPILWMDNKGVPTILDGHRRVQVARDLGMEAVPAVRISLPSPPELVALYLRAQLAARSLNPFEIAGLIRNSLERFRLSVPEMIRLILAEVPGQVPPSLLPGLPAILRLPDVLKREAINRRYSAAFLMKIVTSFSEPLVDAASRLLSAIHLGENQLDTLLEWMDEITQRDGISPEELLKQDPFPFFLSHPSMPTAKKRDALLRVFYEKRFPRRAQGDKVFRELKRSWETVGDLKLIAPKDFMGNRFELRIGFRSPEALKTTLKRALSLTGELHKAFDLL